MTCGPHLNCFFMEPQENDKQDLTVDDYLEALQQRNLVYNHDFRYFSNPVTNGSTTECGIPDGWQYKNEGTDASISFDTNSKQLVIKKSSDGSVMSFRQALHEFPRWEQMLMGKVITACVVLDMDRSGDVNIVLSDAIDSTTITKSGKGSHEVTLQLKINSAAKSISITIETAVPVMTIRLTRVFVNAGMVALPNLPCVVQGIIGERRQYIATETPPAEELSLCNPPVELGNDYTRLNSVLNKRFGEGKNGNSLLIDMRGYFSRSWDNGASVDPNASDRTAPGSGTIKGDHVSTFEQDAFLKHDHGLSFSIDRPILTGKEGAATIINTSSTSKTQEAIDGKETRPKNIAELYTIKWA